MNNITPDTVICKVYDFISKAPACNINNLVGHNTSEGTIRVSLSRLKKAMLVMQHKHSGHRNLFLTTLKIPLDEVNDIVNKAIAFERKEKFYEKQ